ncbi:MAG: hypothetical protein U0R51_00395 [Solirubrobacterales bacterium]
MRADGRAAARPLWKGRWWLPIWSAGLGLVLFAAAAAGGETTSGLIIACCFFVVAVAFAVAERSESLRGIGGVDGDERFARIETRSMAAAGRAMAVAIIAAWGYELTQGEDAAGITWILGVGTIVYVASMVWIRGRS